MSKEWRRIQLSSGNTDGGIKFCKNTIISSRYTAFTFFPKVLVEQFRKGFNIFFITLVILQVAFRAPTNPRSHAIVFTLILILTLIKQGYEDWIRHKADDIVNTRTFFVFDKLKSMFVTEQASDLQVGQIIRLKENDHVPCDVVLLRAVGYSAKVVPKCEIITANLDGEPNTKVRFCPSGLSKLASEAEVEFAKSLHQQQFEFEYDEPKADLYKLNGVIRSKSMIDKSVPISMDNVLLRSTTLKHVQFAYGCVIYTGVDTRLSRNSLPIKRSKFSVVDHTINKLTIMMFSVLVVLVTFALGLFYLNREYVNSSWYMPPEDQALFGLSVTTFFIFLVYLSYMIPIFLPPSLEFQKMGSRMLFGWDNEMECKKTGTRATCNTSDLNEELGQIEYLLTDKTGTLTENILNFVCCSIGTRRFDYKINPITNEHQLFETNQSDTKAKSNLVTVDANVSEYLEAISLCHTVTAVTKDSSNNNDEGKVKTGQIQYQGPSTDEEVLVTASQQLGVIYLGDDSHGKNMIQRNGNVTTFTRHFVFEFDADRKCMSVIVENNESNRYFLITKGAETSLFPKCEANTPSDLLDASTRHVNEFATNGYRTLVIAKKEITAAEVAQIHKEIDQHRKNPDDLQKFYSKFESGLTLLGTTGVEDQLQENVPETLNKLKGAGIRIWMLTGDKMETAVNIGATCGLIPISTLQQSNHFLQENNKGMITSSNIHYLTDATTPQMVFEKLGNLRKAMKKGSTDNSTLVIDGITFGIAFDSHRELLASIALEASQVIFCRMAPLQKAQVVRLIKQTKAGGNARVCAVGDGGNDVAMIQEAHVGIGILGREGRQAGRAADFALPKFEHLQKAILVHGVWFYHRLSSMIAYIFYRGILSVSMQFLYGFDSFFSAQNVYDTDFKAFYNIFFTSTPIIIFGLLEQKQSSKELLQDFTNYKKFRGNTLFDLKTLIWWTFIIVYHACLLAYFPRFVLGELTTQLDWGMRSHLLNGLVMIVPLVKVFTNAVYVNWLLVLAFCISFFEYVVYCLLTAEFFKFRWGGDLKFAYFQVYSHPEVWFTIALTLVLSMLPDLIMGAFRRLDYLRARNNGKSSRF